jgi:trimethylamine---corrinoid protein Co-methyltransferase
MHQEIPTTEAVRRKLPAPFEILTSEEVVQIHETSMRVLDEIGIAVPNEEALRVFKEHGARVEGERVYLTESQVMQGLREIPKQFRLCARNPDRDVIVGAGDPVFAPGYGAPFLVDADEGKRSPTLADYSNLAKISHDLPNQDVSGYLLVEPDAVAQAHLHMLHAHMIHSDKPFMGSTAGAEGARQTLDMARIAFGGDLDEKAVTISLVNSLSPLGYSPEMLDVLLVYAKARQPMVIAALAMAGTTAPISLAGMLAMQTAELMAGIVLTQLVSPGAPVVFGSTSSNVDMRIGSLSIGSPELSMLASAHAQLARFYGIPSRSGGGLTDASCADAQAGFESMMSLMTTVNSGVDFVLHAAGILSSYLAFSYEKFVLDDEMCGMVRSLRGGFPVDPGALAFEVIETVGPGGNYLSQSHTMKRCRTEFWQPAICDRRGLAAWVASGGRDAVDRAKERWQRLLEQHEDPAMDPAIRQRLDDYLDTHLS